MVLAHQSPSSDWIKRVERHLSSVWSPIHLAHVTAMAQRPASARFQKHPRASTAFLPCFFLERSDQPPSTATQRERERERERGDDDGDDEGLARGGGGAVAARVRQRGGRPAGEAAAVRGDGDAEPLLLLAPRQSGAPGSLPIRTRPYFAASWSCALLQSVRYWVAPTWIGRILV